jgi:arylsulfatase A-like enzyme
VLLAACGRPSAPPPVLLVVLDTVRADRTSTYGYERPTTIQLDALAAAGVVFEDVTASAPWTWPSHASLFTGEAPWVHGAHLVSPDAAAHEVDGLPLAGIRAELPTLAERFARAGYRTVSLAANELLRPELGLVRGFERARHFEHDGQVLEAARAEIARADDARPLFLFVNLMSAHSPYREGPGPWAAARPEWLGEDAAPEWARPYLTREGGRGIDLARVPEDPAVSDGITRYLAGELAIPPEGFALLSQLYDAGVRQADFVLGRILEDFAARHPEGVVAVTADHGEALGEHAQLGHLASVYPEVLAVPLVLAAPGRLPAGRRVAEPVEMRRLHATLLDLAGLAPRRDSLVPLARADREQSAGAADAARRRAPGRAPVSASAWPYAPWARHLGGRFARRLHLYRVGAEALVWDGEQGVELYDLARDPGMRSDLARVRAERARELLALAREHFAAAAEGERLALEDDVQERLRALGYALR